MNTVKSTNTYLVYIFLIISVSCILWSCEKEVTLIIPPAENKFVIEGRIENGQIPFVLISQTRDYNEIISAGGLNDFYLDGATVVVTNGSQRDTLQEICSNDLPVEILIQVIELTGLSPNVLINSNICGYLDLDGDMIGETGQSYGLEVTIDNQLITAQTSIPEIVNLDSLWFRVSGDQPDDSLGFAYAQLTDPDTLGNAYRWSAKRINQYPSWSDQAGQQKDYQYIAPLGSAYDDSFFNGLSFEFAYYRGSLSGSGKEDDQNIERGFFKIGDTVAVKGASIDHNTYEYVVSFEAEASSAGNPFTAPSPIHTNINGGIGVWAGYATIYDTLIATP